ncbi:MAG: metal ABC transporter permease [Candidatus Brennerbacteria bacterium]|nr:metal ABC transporter permease [Candidatus Brennerbacteria bacterium]
MINELLLTLLLSGAIALTGGLVGAFALMRRMALAADPMSHIALPGIGLALLFQINPVIGGAVSLITGAFLIWLIEEKTKINIEAVIGVVFAAALAIGTIITPQEELIEALFGTLTSPSGAELAIGLLFSAAISMFILKYRHRIAITLISKELAVASGIKTSLLNFLFLAVFAISIILGLKFLGALLMGSLIIIPAAMARNISWNFNSFLAISAVASFFSMITGVLASLYFNWQLGPSVITIASILFLITLVKRYN